jgi:hypothetical protein
MASVVWEQDPRTSVESLLDLIEHGRPEWHRRASCVGRTAEMFPRSRTNSTAWRDALAICKGCPVRRECDEDAERRNEQFGVWGGRRRQGVASRMRLDVVMADQEEWTVEELCVSVGVSPHAMRRYLRAAANRGLVAVRPDPQKGSRNLYRIATVEERRAS